MAKVSEAKRRNNNAWDAQNMATLGVRVRKEIAEEFKRRAQEEGTTANAVLKTFVLKYLGRAEAPQPPTE